MHCLLWCQRRSAEVPCINHAWTFGVLRIGASNAADRSHSEIELDGFVRFWNRRTHRFALGNSAGKERCQLSERGFELPTTFLLFQLFLGCEYVLCSRWLIASARGMKDSPLPTIRPVSLSSPTFPHAQSVLSRNFELVSTQSTTRIVPKPDPKGNQWDHFDWLPITCQLHVHVE